MDLGLLDKLEKQHREAERILKQLGKASTPAKQQPLVDRFRVKMAEHMRIEEADVYPELQRIDLEKDTEAEIEHDLTRKGLQQLDDMVGKPGFGAAVAMVEAGIAHHVEDEEKKVFPMLRKALRHAPSEDSLNRDELHDLTVTLGFGAKPLVTNEELARAARRKATQIA